jgi:hypothetical protein
MNLEPIEVTARFAANGAIIPLQFTWKGGTYHVESTGRYWRDDLGYHILVMAFSEKIYELIFISEEGRWSMGAVQPRRMVV